MIHLFCLMQLFLCCSHAVHLAGSAGDVGCALCYDGFVCVCVCCVLCSVLRQCVSDVVVVILVLLFDAAPLPMVVDLVEDDAAAAAAVVDDVALAMLLPLRR